MLDHGPAAPVPSPAEIDAVRRPALPNDAIAATRVLMHAACADAPGMAGADAVARAVRAHLLTGGSMVRARLALDTGRRLALDRRRATVAAAAVELLHNASLVHDDLADGDAIRRGRPSLWAAEGRDVALLAGDRLIGAAFATAAGLGAPAVTLLAERLAETAAGQAEDRRGLAACPDTTAYDRIARAKSGPLLALPVELALAAAERATPPTLGPACRHLALAYQLVDDLGDVEADAASGAVNAVLVTERERGLRRTAATAAVRARAARRLSRLRAELRALPLGLGTVLGVPAAALGARVEGSTDAA